MFALLFFFLLRYLAMSLLADMGWDMSRFAAGK